MRRASVSLSVGCRIVIVCHNDPTCKSKGYFSTCRLVLVCWWSSRENLFLGRPFPFLVRSVVFGGNENLKKSWHYDDIVWE